MKPLICLLIISIKCGMSVSYNNRVIALDTETTGFNRKRNGDVERGHRIIEIGAVEMVGGVLTGREFHAYVNPGMKIDRDATKVHGISDDFLRGRGGFEEIFPEFFSFISEGDPLIVIHNAHFDISFLDQEFDSLPDHLKSRLHDVKFRYVDSLELSREMFPSQKNTLDAVADRIGLKRVGAHSALGDAQILAMVFLKIFSH